MGVIDRGAAALSRGIVALALPLFAAGGVEAQGVTTSGVRGQVRAELRPQVDARVRVSHEATGHAVEVHAPSGRFVIGDLQPGGPYTVSVRALGFAPWNRAGIHLTMGELREIDVALRPVAAALDTMKVVVVQGVRRRWRHGHHHVRAVARSAAHAEPGSVRLRPARPADLNEDLAPRNPGFSAGGMGFRFNNFLINGVSDRTLGGGVSSPAGIRSVPLDAVRSIRCCSRPTTSGTAISRARS